MICFWLSMASNVTPPVALAAFAASGIAKSDPMKTGFNAFILAVYLYVMPFAFAYAPQITILGHGFLKPFEMILSFGFATIALAGAVQGWLFRNLQGWERTTLAIATILMITPELVTDVAGFILLVGVTVMQFRKKRKSESLQTA